MNDFWNTLLFILVIPVLIQIYKIYKGKGGVTPSKLFLQCLSFGLSGFFTLLMGGFLGLVWPALPVWSGDPVAFLGVVIVFAGDVVLVISVAYASMMGLYETILKRLFEAVGFAAPEKVALRKAEGFWA